MTELVSAQPQLVFDFAIVECITFPVTRFVLRKTFSFAAIELATTQPVDPILGDSVSCKEIDHTVDNHHVNYVSFIYQCIVQCSNINFLVSYVFKSPVVAYQCGVQRYLKFPDFYSFQVFNKEYLLKI